MIEAIGVVMELNRVLISDAVDVSCREILEGAGIAVDYKPGMSKTDLLAAIKVRRHARVEGRSSIVVG